jgi:hypothetical protein
VQLQLVDAECNPPLSTCPSNSLPVCVDNCSVIENTLHLLVCVPDRTPEIFRFDRREAARFGCWDPGARSPMQPALH